MITAVTTEMMIMVTWIIMAMRMRALMELLSKQMTISGSTSERLARTTKILLIKAENQMKTKKKNS